MVTTNDLQEEIKYHLGQLTEKSENVEFYSLISKGQIEIFDESFEDAKTTFLSAKKIKNAPITDYFLAKCYSFIMQGKNKKQYNYFLSRSMEHLNSYISATNTKSGYELLINILLDVDDEMVNFSPLEKAIHACEKGLNFYPKDNSLNNRMYHLYTVAGDDGAAYDMMLKISRFADIDFILNLFEERLTEKFEGIEQSPYDILRKRINRGEKNSDKMAYLLANAIDSVSKSLDIESANICKELWGIAAGRTRDIEILIDSKDRIKESLISLVKETKDVEKKKKFKSELDEFCRENFMDGDDPEENSEVALVKIRKSDIPDVVKNIPSLDHLTELLNSYVVGQEKANRKLALIFREHLKKVKANSEGKDVNLPKMNALIHGPPGVGKTYSIEVLCENLKMPYWIASSDHLTEEGYVGDSIGNIFTRLWHKVQGNKSLFEIGIVFFDEFDKLASRSVGSSSKDVSGSGAQKNLLTILQGNDFAFSHGRNREQVIVNTRNMLYLLGGSFAGSDMMMGEGSLMDDLVYTRSFEKSIGFGKGKNEKPKRKEGLAKFASKMDFKNFGIVSEICDRVNVIIYFRDLLQEDFVKILQNTDNSAINQVNSSFALDGINLLWYDNAIDLIAEKASQSRGSARILNDLVFDVVSPLYSLVDENKKDFRIDDEFVLNRLNEEEIKNKY
ncbi:MAG: AAA family ATPase [Nanoarchaeota archaeon]|nr:AAA family ATPase [Nanoarchaeota archaeon]